MHRYGGKPSSESRSRGQQQRSSWRKRLDLSTTDRFLTVSESWCVGNQLGSASVSAGVKLA
jgi:hypothetical protein